MGVFATPVHYVAEMSNVRLAAEGILSLGAADAETLAVDFNRVWHDAGIRLMTGRAGQLFGVADEALPAVTCDPEDVLDRHIQEYLPRGEGAPRLRRLMSEIEMWLFDHGVNRSRAAHDALPATALWFWGGGAVLHSLPQVVGWTAEAILSLPRFKKGIQMPLGRTSRGRARRRMTWRRPVPRATWAPQGTRLTQVGVPASLHVPWATRGLQLTRATRVGAPASL